MCKNIYGGTDAASLTTSLFSTVPGRFINFVLNTQANSRVLLIASQNLAVSFSWILFGKLKSKKSKVHTDLELLREPVWAWLRQHCPSFTDMSANAVFSDIFRLSTVGQMNMELKSLFLIEQTNQSFFCTCNHPITKCTSVFVLYKTSRNLSRHNKFECSVSEAI